ncbi:MAG: NUDIX hydrolase [Gammaproteobacteria bacterium]|nr:NUDIX hydrolase [Gammaproteobacteria bacterium]
MHRDKLLTLLAGYADRYPDEDTTRRFRTFVEGQPRCFERDCWDDGHVTGSAVVLDSAGTSMLMTHHAKLGRWLQLGGHADGDPDPLAVACREATEESGLSVVPIQDEILDLDIHTIPPRGPDPAHFHYDVRFLLKAERPGSLQVTHESLALRWVPLGNIEAVTNEESVLRMVRKSLGRKVLTPSRNSE